MSNLLFLDVADAPRMDFYSITSSKELQKLTPAERLFFAVENDDKMTLRHCLEKEKIDINTRSAEGDTIVHYLSKRTSKLGQMKHVYRLGADFSAKGAFGATPLLQLCENPSSFFEKIETIRWVLSVAPNTLEEPDEEGLTPFLAACQSGQLKIVRLMLDLGANRFAKTLQGHTAQFLCTQFDHIHVLYTLVMEYGLDVQGEDINGRTCLHWAAYHGSVQLCAFLRRLGLSALAQDDMGRTPLHWTAVRGHVVCVQVLTMGQGIQALTMHDKDNNTPIALAVKHSGYGSRIFRAVTSKRIYKKRVYEPTMFAAIIVILVLVIASWYMMYRPDRIAPCPLYTQVFYAVLEFTIVYSLWKACFTDPGSIAVDDDLSTSALRLGHGEMDRFSPMTDQFPVCYTCNSRRVLRSKHSVMTNKCIARFDHYCPYVSNDVGLGNQSYFYMFLLSVTITTTVGLGLFYEHLFGPYLPQELIPTDPPSSRLQTAYIAFKYQPLLFSVLLLDIGVIMFVGGLLFNMTLHVITNLSTNEGVNWLRYRHFVDKDRNRFRNPFNRGLLTNIREYFGLERLPSGGFGRLVHWRTCTDIASYTQLRETLDAANGKTPTPVKKPSRYVLDDEPHHDHDVEVAAPADDDDAKGL